MKNCSDHFTLRFSEGAHYYYDGGDNDEDIGVHARTLQKSCVTDTTQEFLGTDWPKQTKKLK